MKLVGVMNRLALLVVAAMLGSHIAVAQTPPAPQDAAAAWTYLNALSRADRLVVLEREARREGRAVVYGALGIDRADLFVAPFEKKYPGIKIDFVRLGEPELVDKMLLEARTGRINSDVAISNIPWLDLLNPVLAPYQPTTWDEFVPTLRLGGADKGWTAMAYEILPSAIAWRTDRVTTGEAPKTLDQVMDPKWKGRVGTTTQLESMVEGLITAYGEPAAMEKVKALASLDNRLYRSIAALSDALAQGEIDVAWNMGAHRPSKLKAAGASVDFVLQDPLFGQGITLSATKGAAHPYAAALFFEFATDPKTLEQVDKAEPGRFFGNRAGHYTLNVADYPRLILFAPIGQARFRELKQLTDRLFVRGGN
jgi:iron(III) transport system substrate-binding protein